MEILSSSADRVLYFYPFGMGKSEVYSNQKILHLNKNNSNFRTAIAIKLSVMTGKEIFELQEKVAMQSDPHAFKLLFRYYYTGLFRFAMSIVKLKEAAEEIVEDVFVAIWNKRSTITAISNLRIYLYIAVKNRCFNYVRRATDKEVMDLDDIGADYFRLVPDPEDMLVASELLQRVNKAILNLSPRCRIAYKLVKEEGLTYREVAEVLNISPRTVENHIASAIRKIAASLNIDLAAYQKSSSVSSGF